jgi:hypothetical protein
MFGVALCDVAARAAGRGRNRARVGLMAARALGVPAGRAVGFFLVAALTSCTLGSAVRLMAMGALGVARFDLALLLRVTTAAAREQ